MKTLIVLPFLISLAACASRPQERPEPIITPIEVAVGVPSPCVPDTLAPKPDYVDTNDKLRAAEDASVRYQLVLAGRLQRDARLNEIEPIVEACPRGKSK